MFEVPTIVEGVTKATKAFFENIFTGIVEDKNASAYNVVNYGAVGNGKHIIGCTSSAGTAIVKCPTASFTSADVGKFAMAYEDFAKGTIRKIEVVLSATEVKLDGNSGVTQTGNTNFKAGNLTNFIYGSDESAAINACLEAAADGAAFIGFPAAGFNQPLGLGFGEAHIPALPGGGVYMCAEQIVVPSGVVVDMQGTIVNVLTSRTEPVMLFKQGSDFKRLFIECLFGAGVAGGEGKSEEQAEIRGGEVTLWHVGEEEIAGVPQRGVFMNGGSFLIDAIWMKGGFIGVQMQPGSDCTVNRAHLIGCKEPLQINKANMVHFGVVLLDTCGAEGGGFNGISVNEESSQISFGEIKAFQVVGSKKKLTAVLAVGEKGVEKGSILTAKLSAQRCGGAVIKLDHAQDVFITFEGSNNTTPSSSTEATTEFTTGVAYGGAGAVSGNCMIIGSLTGSITPYSGTISGTYMYTRGSTKVIATGAVAPTAAALANAGTTPAAPTVSADSNDGKGSVTFHSGTGTPAVGEQVEVKFNSTTVYVAAPKVFIEEKNAAAKTIGCYVSNVTTSGFKVSCIKAPGVSENFEIDYAIVG